MTISADYAPDIDVGNGTTLAFAVTFPFADPADLAISLFDMAAGADLTPPPALGGMGRYDYTVTGTPEPGLGIYPHGTVTFRTAPPGNTKVVRARATPQFQEVVLIDNARFPAKAVEGGLDHLELQIQEMDSRLSRAIVAPASDGPVNLVLPPEQVRADHVLTFDGNGNIATPGVAVGPLDAAIAAFLAGLIAPAATSTGWARTLAAALVLYAAPVVLADGQPMVVDCRSSANDGYGGLFVYRAGDAATVFPQSGLGFVDAAGRRWFRIAAAEVNVKWFGAVGDGITNDAAAFTAAVSGAQGKTLFLPKANYVIASLVDVTGVAQISGEGMASVLTATIGSANPFLTATGGNDLILSDFKIVSGNSTVTLSLCNRLRVRNLFCNGNTANASALTAQGLILKGCDNVEIEDCTFYDYNDAIYLDKSGTTDCNRVRVAECWFEHTTHGNFFQFPAQVYQFHCTHLTVDNCDFRNIFPGLAGGGSLAYSVYEGDGTANSCEMLNCRVILTDVDTRHIAMRTTFAQMAVMQGNALRAETAGCGGMMCTLNAISEIVVRDNVAIGFDVRLVENGSCVAVDFSGNALQDCGRASPDAAVRFGVSTNGTGINLATARGNKIYGAQFGGIMFNTCFWFAADGNEIIDGNRSNTLPNPGLNDFQVSGISAFGSTNGAIRGNYVANLFGAHLKYGISSGSPTHTIDIWIPGTFPLSPHTTNRFAGIEVANLVNPNGDGTRSTA